MRSEPDVWAMYGGFGAYVAVVRLALEMMVGGVEAGVLSGELAEGDAVEALRSKAAAAFVAVDAVATELCCHVR